MCIKGRMTREGPARALDCPGEVGAPLATLADVAANGRYVMTGGKESSPSMARNAEEDQAGSEGPLLAGRKRERKVPRRSRRMQSSVKDRWHRNCQLDEEYLDEKKSHKCLWIITGVLAFIAFCNLILNITILVVLRVSKGMEAIEAIPEKNLIKFYGNTDLDRVCLQKGVCEGFGDQPIELIGDEAPVNIQVGNHHNSMVWSSLQVEENGTTISNVELFEVKDPDTGATIFSTDFPSFDLPHGVKRLEANVTQTNRIVAPKKSNLTITSDESIFIHGAEGTHFDAKTIEWSAKKKIHLHSRNGDILVDAKDIKMPNLPKVSTPTSSQSHKLREQYKVCICMPEGKVFLMPVQKKNPELNCATYAQSTKPHPCAL